MTLTSQISSLSQIVFIFCAMTHLHPQHRDHSDANDVSLSARGGGVDRSNATELPDAVQTLLKVNGTHSQNARGLALLALLLDGRARVGDFTSWHIHDMAEILLEKGIPERRLEEMSNADIIKATRKHIRRRYEPRAR